MKRLLFSFALIVTAAFAQYKVEPASPLPSDLAAPFASGMGAGYKIVGPNGVYCEIWFKNALPKGEKVTEDAVAFPTIPQGSLVGAIRFPGAAADRRGQPLKPGLYTLRYSLQPNNGDHLGAAPQRDFLVLIPVADDKDPKTVPVYDELMAMSKKASGTPHPAVLSIEPASGSQFPSMNKEGDKDWALTVKIGDQPISVILIGKVEA